VMQDSLLFNLTIRDNLRLAKDDASIEELENACEKAELLDFIRGLKDGFETVIGERGIRLSGGQKQRFAIARVLLQKPDVIIFDEATSSLDHETEKNLKQNLEDFLRGKTTITIAHRFSTITTADKVIVLGDGRICAIGTHSQLQDTCDEYRRLFQRQWA
ncbi:MAG: ATP-binding cassette domain-containing protein, partial [Firmicutes bacterium]|nr:ATP-binding cassette domain-containing protein [Bacillota bacterium]